jgi:hypothetical protein
VTLISADAAPSPTGFVTDGTYASAFRSATFPTTMNMADASGRTHALLVFFTRAGPVTATVDLAIVQGDTGGVADTLVAVAPQKTLNFGATGQPRLRARLGTVLPLADGTAGRIIIALARMTLLPGPSGITCVVQDGCALDL